MTQEDAEKIIAAAQQLGDGIGALLTAAGLIVGAISVMRAAFSASPMAQIRKVDSLPDVTVVPITPKGAEQIEKARK